ncbi:MAG TPA: hypothetical protein VGN72_22895 [Tepidisphaeraceae bacterium]|nr:hypothetical protein [Tepidisphaeraceae bacterium]
MINEISNLVDGVRYCWLVLSHTPPEPGERYSVPPRTVVVLAHAPYHDSPKAVLMTR